MLPIRVVPPAAYYVQYIDSVRPVNEHVEGGLFDHRRVDDPELAHKTRKDGETFRTRSVELSSESLGLTGKLDCLEETDGAAAPVETKHGKAPHDADGNATAWDNDAVQLCGQALFLESDSGILIPRGYQY